MKSGHSLNTINSSNKQGGSKENCLGKLNLQKYSNNIKGARSLTPVSMKNKIESSHILNDPLTPKGLPKLKRDILHNEARIKTDFSVSNPYLNKVINKNLKPKNNLTYKTPKQDIKNFIMFNQNNNYTKKFIIKQTIENSHIYKKSNSKEAKVIKNLLKGDKENSMNNCDKHELNNKSPGSKLNINVQNVNISLNNNLNLNDENKRFDDRKLSILDIGGAPLINIDNNIHSEEDYINVKEDSRFY